MKQLGARVGALAERAMLALAAVGCAVPAYRYAEVATLRANAPFDASRIARHDAKTLANALGSRFDSNPELKPSARDIADIRSALARQPLEPKLLGILGLAYEASGDPRRAAEAMRLANRASRRDSISGLYLIESASASGDVKATLRHYNAVLSTQPELNAVLLPILSSAIAYPEIRTELRPYLRSGAKWAPAFLTVAAKGASVNDLKLFLMPLPKGFFKKEYEQIASDLLHRIAIEAGQEQALEFAEATLPNFSYKTLSSISVGPSTLDKRLGRFAWTFPPVNGIDVGIDEEMAIEVNAEPLTTGAVAMRDVILKNGVKYKFRQNLQYRDEVVSLDAKWKAYCVTYSKETLIWEQRLPTRSATYVSELWVPQNCPVVRFVLVGIGADGQLGSSLIINKLDLY